jgi:hypothetical protein
MPVGTLEVIRGATKTLKIGIRDTDNNLITNLDAADKIRFVVKLDDVTNYVYLVDLDDSGAQVVVNSPDYGYIKVILYATDTIAFPIGFLDAAVQIEYDLTNVHKWQFDGIFKVVETWMANPT